jgi:hypothetical protein
MLQGSMQMLVGLVTFCSAAAALRFPNIFTPFCLRISKPHSYEYFSIRQSAPATYANPHCWRVAQNAYLGFSRIETNSSKNDLPLGEEKVVSATSTRGMLLLTHDKG